MRRVLIAFALAALPACASAAGEISCNADDANLKLRFEAVIGPDDIAPWTGIQGQLETRLGNLPMPISSFAIEDKHLTERWRRRENMMLQIQNRDASLSNAIILTVAARQVEEGRYKGIYDLRITTESGAETHITKTGNVTCGAE